MVIKSLIGIFGLVVVLMCILHFGVLPYYDNKHNAVMVAGPYQVSHKAQTFHNNAFVADMHADPLLWGRDLRNRHDRGQLDLPRLIDGGVDLQVFSVVTKVPKQQNYHSNSSDTDSLPLLFIASWQSPKTWFSPKQRALAQAYDLKTLAKNSSLSLVLKRGDLSISGIKGLLALEGMHALEGESKTLNEFYAAGYRMMGLAHFFDNKIAGSAHGIKKYGLTELGQSLIPKMEKLGITIDLAHASPQAIEDTLNLATKPVVVSHGGVKGTCKSVRNLTDAQIRSIAKNNGVIGIGYWESAVCDLSLSGIVSAILYTIDIAGIDHVGLGSDFDGHVKTPFDTSGLPMITQALLASRLSKSDINKVLGGNIRRVLVNNLPE